MFNTNVELSKNELELVTNSEFILTKNRIIEKVYKMFGLLSESYKIKLNSFVSCLPEEVFMFSPKIYKGENYLNLPYVMMDHPRVFLKEDVFAIRSFFWWGNYFSITLQLSGKYLQAFKSKIESNLDTVNTAGYFICINENKWQHHFEETNYKPLNEIESLQEMFNQPFIKIACKHSLTEWDKATIFFESNYAAMLRLLS
jgi:hypothetical protein